MNGSRSLKAFILTWCLFRMGGVMASPERKDLQEQVWREIIDVLRSKVSDVEQLAQQSLG